MVLALIQVLVCRSSSFLFIAKKYSMAKNEFINSPDDEELDRFCFLATTDKAALNIYVEVFVGTYSWLNGGLQNICRHPNS